MKANTKNIPALRFPEFKDEWNRKKLSELSTLITKGTTPSKFVKSGIKFIKIECFKDDRIDIEKCLFIDDLTHNKELKRSILNEGDILFAIAGATIGKCNIVTKEILPANTNQALSIIRLNSESITKFTYYNLKSDLMQKYIVENISVGAQPNLNLEQMGNFSFYLPNISEQQKIADFLTAVDERIQQLTKKKQLLEQYKKGVMQQLFSQQLRFKDENGNSYPDWEIKELKRFATVNPKSPQLPFAFTYIDLESVEKGRLILEKQISINDAPSRAQRVLERDDILFQMVRPYQKNNLYFNCDGKYVASTGYAQIRTSQNSMYLYQYLHSDEFINAVMSKCTGSSYPAINSQDLSNIKVKMPIYSEQNKIAILLNNLDNKIKQLQTQIDKTQAFKKGLLQQMFV